MNNISGVYEIKNTVDGTVYIGQSRNMMRRLKKHMLLLVSDKHPVRSLQNDWSLYGISAFHWTILEIGLNKEERIYREEYWMIYKSENGIQLYNNRIPMIGTMMYQIHGLPPHVLGQPTPFWAL